MNYFREGLGAPDIGGKQTFVRRKSYHHGLWDSSRHGLTRAASRSPASLDGPHKELLKFSEICSIAQGRGMQLRLKTLGPLYTIECRDGGSPGNLLATTNGFVVPPLKLMHCDTMRIFTSRG